MVWLHEEVSSKRRLIKKIGPAGYLAGFFTFIGMRKNMTKVKERWMVHTKKAPFDVLAKKYGIDPVVARIIRNRDVVSDEDFEMFLSDDMTKLHNPGLLKDVDRAVSIIDSKIKEKKKFCVVGDYDVDGICSTYILVTALKRIGAVVDYVVPHRITDGYGINKNIVNNVFEDGTDTIITCDNGIAAVEQVELAKSLGMTVIITDHHDIPFVAEGDNKRYVLPQADAIINPKQNDCKYPFDGICGAVVAYKLCCRLYEAYGIEDELGAFDEFIAIATVADVMQLKDENRIIVKNGLKKMAVTGNLGLSALMNICEINPENVTSYDIGFRIGPCLNASGRLDTASEAVKLLMTKSNEEAQKLASYLVVLNDERKELTEKGKLKAIEMIDSTDLKDDKILVLYLDECHESIAGIIAGRIKEAYNRPTLVFTNGQEGIAKGSGRSIECYNMFEELSKCKELFEHFGGHPMAAGVSLPVENIEKLRKRLNESTTLTDEDLVKTVWIDVPMPLDYISFKVIADIDKVEPFGTGNPKPVFAEQNILVKSLKVVGKNANVVKMTLVNGNGCAMDATYFGEVDEFCQNVSEGCRYTFTYYPRINDFRDEKTLQIVVTGYK